MRAAIPMALAAFVCGLVAGKAAAQTADGARLLRYGEHLSQECTSCHRRDGADTGIPSLPGMTVEDFVATMGFYQSGARDNAAMVSVAKSLDEAQIKALAAYFATLPKPAKRAPAPPAATPALK